MNNKDCFMEVTNEDIYREIQALRADINTIKPKLKVSQWMSATALTLTVGVIIGFVCA